MSNNGGKRRAKGFIDSWEPKPHVAVLLDHVQDVLRSYRDYLPLTARQVFYRLVGQYDYDKTEQAYSRLCETLVKARRARIVPFSAIRDDGTVSHGSGGYEAMADFWQSELAAARYYRLDRSLGQEHRIELWCEAAGMAPQLANVARDYGVSVYSTGGFSSVTVTYEIARRVLMEDRPTIFMHVGDYDPSGESIFNAMAQDVAAFVADDLGCDYDRDDPDDAIEAQDQFVPRRVALTRRQVERYGLPTAPPKRSDTRSRNWTGQTCQAEALDPSTLADVVRDAIEVEYDMDVHASLVQRESRERRQTVEDVETILEQRKGNS